MEALVPTTNHEGTPMPRPPKVYLIMQPTVKKNGALPDLTPLGAHGDVTVLVLSGEFPTFDALQCLRNLFTRLEDFDPTIDSLAWAGGDTLAAVLVGVVLAEQGHEWFTWLRYERGRDGDGRRTDVGATYTPYRVPLFLTPQPDTNPVSERKTA